MAEDRSPAPESWLRAYTRQELAEIDRRCERDYGLASIVLMENAGAGLAGVVLDELDELAPAGQPRVLIVCGTGNNGGDGFVAARHLHNEMCEVVVTLVGEAASLAGPALSNFTIIEKMGLPIARSSRGGLGEIGGFDLIVDAMFGTGLARPIEGRAAKAIEMLEQHRDAGAVVVAADVPSGLDCDSGRALGPCVVADLTAAFVGIKRGFLSLDAQQVIGRVEVVPIGAPRELIERFGTPIEGDVGLWDQLEAEDEPADDPGEEPGERPADYGGRADRP